MYFCLPNNVIKLVRFMKLKIYIQLLLLVIISSSYAQVGIGTTSPNTSSMLDITSTNSGLLIPRVALTSTSDVTTIASPAISLLVYNVGFSPNGYYYWNGSVWVQLAIASNSNWFLTGNSGTSATTNFIGTTDNIDLVFRRHNRKAGYIGNPTYDVNFEFTDGNTSFGANSLVNPTLNFSNQSGVRNTAFGVNVMPNLTTGRLNTGIGEFALFSNTTGITNTAIGSGTLYSNSVGNSNVAVGRQALTSSNSDNNTAVGFASLRQNASGTNNTALGFEALRGVLGSGNVGIGYQAGRTETGSNKLYIENSNANANNALIYGEFDTNIVRINGTLQISNPASAPGYALPNVRGTAGQFLQTNGAGSTSWTSNTGILPYTTTGAATGTYNVTLAQHTVRVFGSITDIVLPTPVGNMGKTFVIIGSNGISTKGFTSSVGIIYDDATNSIINSISSGVRYTVQSDGTDWIVIAN